MDPGQEYAMGGVEDDLACDQAVESAGESWVMQGRNRRSRRGRLCMWKMDMARTSRVWGLVNEAVGPDEKSNILKISKVIQRDGRLRFDLDVHLSGEGVVLEALRKVRARIGWHVRPHVPWRVRHEDRGCHHVRKGYKGHYGAQVRILSWNMSSANGRLEVLGYLAFKEHLDVIVCQETRRGVGQWRLRMDGYHSIESLASDDRACNGLARAGGEEPGRNGLLVLVRDGINAYEVGAESGYWIFVRVSGGPFIRPCIIGNIYRPHDRRMSKVVMEGIKKQIETLHRKFPDDAIILMGDFNKSGKDLDKDITSWSPV